MKSQITSFKFQKTGLPASTPAPWLSYYSQNGTGTGPTRNGNFSAPARVVNGTGALNTQNIDSELYEITDWRYQACYDGRSTNSGIGDVLEHIAGTGVVATPKNCARYCWNHKTTDGQGRSVYSNWIFYALDQGGSFTGPSRCLCGNRTLTGQHDSGTCWGPEGTMYKAMCDQDPTSACGSATSAIVHGRADIIGTCARNGSNRDDYLINWRGSLDQWTGLYGAYALYCYETQNINRTTDPGCETDASKCAYRRQVYPDTTTTTTSESPFSFPLIALKVKRFPTPR